MAERTHLTAAASREAPERNEEEARSAEDIRKDIAARRETITDTVDRISDRFHRTLDWRSWVANYPLAALGVVAGAGFLLSGLFKPRPTPGQRIKAALAEGVEDLAERFREHFNDISPNKPALSRTVKAAATGAITQAVANYLRNRFSGYAEQYYERYYGQHPAEEYSEEADRDDWTQARQRGEQRANFEPHF